MDLYWGFRETGQWKKEIVLVLIKVAINLKSSAISKIKLAQCRGNCLSLFKKIYNKMQFIHTATWILFLILFYEEYIYLCIYFVFNSDKRKYQGGKNMLNKILRRKTEVVWYNTYLFKQNFCFTAYYEQVIKCIVEQLPKNVIIFII